MPSNHLILCHLLLLLPSIFPRIKVFSNESALLVRWSKYWSFSFIISPSNEYSGLFSFRIDLFDLLAVQWTQEFSPALQFKSINSSVFSLLYGPILSSTHDYWKKKHMVFWLCGPLSAKWCLCFWKHGLVSSISFICLHKNFTKIMKAFIHSCLILGAMKISFSGWTNKLWYILTMEYHSVLKGNEPWSELEETSAYMLLREKANPKWLHTI